MLIDWFTVFAQFVNFLILVYLLKRFLYKPILQAIDEREQRIAAQLQDAANLQTLAKQEQLRYQQLHQELDQKKSGLLQEAHDLAVTEHRRLLEEARHEYAALRKNLHEKLEAEQSSLQYELKRQTQREVFAIARKVLGELAGTTLEEQIIAVFLQKLSALGEKEAEQIRISLKATNEPLSIRSAFDLTPAQQNALEQAVKKLMGNGNELQFRVIPAEVGGIELAADGYKISWTIAEYLDGLEKKINVLANGVPGSPKEATMSSHDE